MTGPLRAVAVAWLAIVTAFAAVACGDDATAPGQPAEPLVTPDHGAASVVNEIGEGERRASSLRIAAASDLRDALEVMKQRMEDVCETQIVPVYGSSGQLKEQILAGAPFGVFLSADSGFPSELDNAGLVVSGGIADYAVGHLVVVTRDGIEPASSIANLADGRFERIAIANPGHAPYGRAAEQAMATAGMTETLEARLVFGENVRQSLDYVVTGNADAGIVALSLVANQERNRVLVDGALHDPIVQTGAVIRGTGAEITGRCVLQFLLNAKGQTGLAQFGFESAGAQ